MKSSRDTGVKGMAGGGMIDTLDCVLKSVVWWITEYRVITFANPCNRYNQISGSPPTMKSELQEGRLGQEQARIWFRLP